MWIAAGILAAAYLAAGLTKLTKSKADREANPNLGWTQDFSQPAIRASERRRAGRDRADRAPDDRCAATLTRSPPWGLVIVQAGAIVLDVRRKAAMLLPVDIVLLLLAPFVAIGRFAIGRSRPVRPPLFDRPGYSSAAGGGTQSTGRLDQCSSLCGVEPRMAPRSGLSP